MFRKLNTFLSLILISAFVCSPAKAVSPDYVVLESITAINSTILLGEDLEYELVVSAPKDFAWDPTQQNIDGKISILLCADFISTGNEESITCNYANQQSKYQLRSITEISVSEIGNYKYYTFKVSGILIINLSGEYFPFFIKIVRASIEYPEFETHYYYSNQINPTDGFSTISSITSPSLFTQKINVLDQPEPPEEIAPEPEPEIEEVIPEEPPVVVVPPPAPPAGRSQGGGAQPASPVVVNELLEQEVLALPLSGNQVWKPMRGIKGKFENWKVGKKNSINGANPLFTRTNLSMMTFRTTGDSVSLRYLGGKKRGSFSIYVNGEFVERIDAKTKKKRKLVKTWEGLGEGRHIVDIVAELDRGESIAINGVQRPRLN